MKIFLLLAAPSLALLGCQQTAKPKKERPVQIDTMQLIAPPAASAVKVASNEVNVVRHDSTTYIRFNDCYFSLDWIKPEEQRNDFELHPDTLFFRLENNHTIEGQMLAVTAGEAEKIKVFQSYETSAVIEEQALHNWKHYRAAWETLHAEANNFFICKTYTAEERSRFPATSIDVLQQFVKRHYPAGMYARVAQLDSFPTLPVKIAISRYYIKLSGIHKDSPDKINKLLVIDVPFKGKS
ncbi:hypothetical protein CLV51_101548 [Chitinophaga niastensis]|uniref:Uncharacterized protein n=1 Tax=Chitinophaga niastensis TaxID=536980 RepID=A0A2P8HSP4_CHINA|nr:hypothetical protein [Chitinophaga niastensis]PSL49218.1 hypothetical protein CLV51_101548 [Chitinophaga niastensis]